MIERLLAFSVHRRIVVVFLALCIAAIGIWNLPRLPIDAVPDITNVQVQINTVARALGPVEIEKRVTYPVETAVAGIPGLVATRSISRSGFSQVTAVFSDGTEIYFARQQVAERLAQARSTFAEGADPQMGAISTGLGEVLSWAVSYAPHDQRSVRRSGQGWQPDGSYLTPNGERLRTPVELGGYLRTVQDWIIRPQLRTVPGVAGVDAIGGYEKQYVVSPDPTRLAAYRLSLPELIQGLTAANVSTSGDYVQHGGEAFLVRSDGRVKTADDIAGAVIATRGAVPVKVGDVATVAIGGGLRTGAGTLNGHEAVIGTVQMLSGANSRVVASTAGEKLTSLATSLPPGITVKVVYDRSKLVDATIHTVSKNLAEGALLVIVVLFALLGNIRAAIITSLVIPFAMLVTVTAMNALGVSGNLMSLGALDFGLIVDGAVIIVENSLRLLAERQQAEGRALALSERLDTVRASAREMIQPTLYGQAIILLVYAPLLTFQGVEGKLFTPMAVTVMLALAGALIASLTLVPALVALLIRKPVAEHESRPIAAVKQRYRPAIAWVMARPWPVIGAGVALLALAALVFTSLGREFTPQLDEGDVALETVRVPSMPIQSGLALQTQAEKALLAMPEVALVYSKMGTAEAATDPMPAGSGDGFVIMKPRAQWPNPDLTKEALIAKMEERLEPLVGSSFEFTQPIQMRFNELIAGVRGDIAIKVFGEDLDVLAATAAKIQSVVSKVPGAADLRTEQVAGFPTFDVKPNRAAIAEAGLTVQDVSDAVGDALGGKSAGVVLQGDQQFDIVVRLADALRDSPDAIGALPIPLPAAGGGATSTIPLRQLARISYIEGLNQVSRENGQRRIVVQANVRGSDLGSFVAAAQARVAKEVVLPSGVTVEWGGQFENLQSAQRRLALVVPACLALILALLYGALGSIRAAGAVFSAVPMALAGGVLSLAARGIPFSVSAAVGFIALSGVAVLNGLVLLSAIRTRLDAGEELETSIIEGALERVRPVLTTALVASLGFVPMALATGPGAEVQKPLATVVIGGLVTATVLTLLVLPAICKLVLRRTSISNKPVSITTARQPELAGSNS